MIRGRNEASGKDKFVILLKNTGMRVRRFYSGMALVVYACSTVSARTGLQEATDVFQKEVQYTTKNRIESMKCLKSIKPENDPVYRFIIKKEQEGKPSKVARLNKFLRIY